MKSERRQPGNWPKRRPATSYSAGALHGCPGQWLSTPSCRWVHARWGQGGAADWPSRSKASWPACSTTRCSPWALPPPPLARHNSPWHHVCLHAHATVQWSATSTAFLGSAVAPCGHIQASQLGTAPLRERTRAGTILPPFDRSQRRLLAGLRLLLPAAGQPAAVCVGGCRSAAAGHLSGRLRRGGGGMHRLARPDMRRARPKLRLSAVHGSGVAGAAHGRGAGMAAAAEVRHPAARVSPACCLPPHSLSLRGSSATPFRGHSAVLIARHHPLSRLGAGI